MNLIDLNNKKSFKEQIEYIFDITSNNSNTYPCVKLKISNKICNNISFIENNIQFYPLDIFNLFDKFEPIVFSIEDDFIDKIFEELNNCSDEKIKNKISLENFETFTYEYKVSIMTFISNKTFALEYITSALILFDDEDSKMHLDAWLEEMDRRINLCQKIKDKINYSNSFEI